MHLRHVEASASMYVSRRRVYNHGSHRIAQDCWMLTETVKASFIKPMLLLPTTTLPEATGWVYELKLDGYRAIAFKTSGRVQLRSRNNKDFNRKYPGVADALRSLPGETVIDGEIVALDDTGRPSFNALQNYGSSNV